MAPTRHPSACRKSILVAVNCAPIVAWAVSIIVADARTYDGTIVVRSVIRIRITVVVGRIIRRWIIVSGVIRRHVRAFRATAQESCDDACAKE